MVDLNQQTKKTGLPSPPILLPSTNLAPLSTNLAPLSTNLAPLSPEIRTSKLKIRIKLIPNFWGRGAGGEGAKKFSTADLCCLVRRD